MRVTKSLHSEAFCFAQDNFSQSFTGGILCREIITNPILMKYTFRTVLASLLVLALFVPISHTNAFSFSRSLNMQSSGDDVRELQFLLTKEGFFKGYISGNYGVLTVNGVRKLQQKLGLKADGAFGPKTIEMLNKGSVLGAYAETTDAADTDEKVTDEAVDDVSRIGPSLNIRPEKILFTGGATSFGSARFNDVYASSNMQQWNLVSANGAPDKWSGRPPHAAVYFQNKYWVIGYAGSVAGVTPTIEGDIWNSTDGVNWTLINSNPPFGNYYGYSVEIYNDRIYVVGGAPENMVNAPGYVWSSTDGINWRVETNNAPFGARVNSTVVAFNGVLYMIGGSLQFDPTIFTDIWLTDDGVSWTRETATSPFGYTYLAKPLVFQKKLYLLGTSPTGSPYYNGVWVTIDGTSWMNLGETLPGVQFGVPFAIEGDAIVANNKIWVGDKYQNLWNSTDGINWNYSGTVSAAPVRGGYKFVTNGSVLIPESCTINSFTGNPLSIIAGNSLTLSWSTTGCGTVNIEPLNVYPTSSYPLSGSVNISPTSTTTYTLYTDLPAGCTTNTGFSPTTGIPCGSNLSTHTLSVIVTVLNPNLDRTPRIAYWRGKVNQHVDTSTGQWQTDPDGVSGSGLDKLTYCRKWYPSTVSVRDYQMETITTWMTGGNSMGPYTNTVMTTQCEQ